VVTLDNIRIYHTGDTDLIPEMSGIGVDIALVPVSGTYVMTAEEAVQAVARIKPKIAIPMHYGAIVGDKRDATKFSRMASCEVQLLEVE
jgi:L-ascorbate metabolism protein UlaG (beta-lactamase superfamily)